MQEQIVGLATLLLHGLAQMNQNLPVNNKHKTILIIMFEEKDNKKIHIYTSKA